MSRDRTDRQTVKGLQSDKETARQAKAQMDGQGPYWQTDSEGVTV